MKIKHLIMAALAASFISSACIADTQTHVYLGQWSRHTRDEGDEYNETHELIGIEHKNVFITSFVNSYSDRSYFGGYRLHTSLDDVAEIGIKVGLVHGYEDLWQIGGGLSPMALPELTLKYDNIGVVIHHLPFAFTSVGFRFSF